MKRQKYYSVIFALICFGTTLFAQKVSLNYQKTPLVKVFEEITRQTKLPVSYTQPFVNPNEIVTISVTNEELENVLKRLFNGKKVSYEISDRGILLYQTKNEKSSAGPVKISGVVTDEKNQTVYGAYVVLPGSGTGAVTDLDGHYEITVPKMGVNLEVTYIGYKKKIVAAKQSDLNIRLEEDVTALNEVVVTAMGIERKSATLTYATQTVGGNEVSRAKESNLINSLQGKSAGLVITPNAGGAGGASKILLRGNASILGNNAPLIVVDGIPMYNRVSSQLGIDGGANLMFDGANEGDALSQINPDDVASITVLKGANAAALYGSAASNGVLMITTKKGQQGALKIDFSSNTTFERPMVLPKLQNVYGSRVVGGKADGYYITQDSWGGRLSEMTEDQLNPLYSTQRLTNTPYDIRDFYNTGINLNNSIAFSGGTEKVQSYFSYGNNTAYGITPDNSFQRHNFTLQENFSFFNNRLKANFSGNYINQTTKNRPGGGIYFSPLYNLYTAARNADMNYYKDNYSAEGSWQTKPYDVLIKNTNGEQVLTQIVSTLNGPRQQWFMKDSPMRNNPWWLTSKNNSSTVNNHVFGNVGFSLNLLEGLDVQARMKYDYMEETSETQKYATTMDPAEMSYRGRLLWNHNYYKQFYGDFLISYARTIKDFSFSANAGGSMTRTTTNNWGVTPVASSGRIYTEDLSCNQFILGNIYINGGGNGDITSGGLPVKDWDCSLFATGQIGYKDKINLEGSYRDDWYRAFTQFPNIKKHFPYWSLGVNSLLNNVIELPKPINDLKVRASYSEVGNSIPNSLFLQSAKRNPATGKYTMSGQQDFKDPKPETTASFEAGFDLSMFDRAVNFDITYYHALMRNQFMSYKGSGGKTIYANSGKVLNQGVEFTASYIYEVSNNFSWKTGFNFSYNDNKIISTVKKLDGKDYLREVDLGNSSGLKVKFIPGGSYGDLYATDFLRDDNGNIRINKIDGSPLLNQGTSDTYLGNMNAKYNLGWNNTFNYKDFQFYFLIDGRIGGKVVSFTEGFLDYYGVSERTAEDRLKAERENIVWTNKLGDSYPGIVMPDGNITRLETYYTATSGNTPLGRNYVYDGTNFRLREVSLGYTFRDLFGKSKNFTLSVNGRNLFFIYKAAPIDPETSLTTQNALGNVDVFSLPTTSSFGIALKATF